ncbi:alkene reductase [Staphylococcus shinii]|uniref:alkene reductase n=1 Tax=Staphylococcus shinii TaxID=2912228 RepID=UPI003CF41771
MSKLWNPIKVGNMELKHRLAMSPMTRSRAYENGVPNDLTAEYYSQRASLGLIITEGTQPSDDGQGYMNSPGIYRQEHIDGWKKVIDKVHDNGAYIFIQLMHAGRISHPDNTPHHRQAVAPSAITPDANMHTAEGSKPIPEPRELSVDEIQDIIEEFKHAATSAIEAGADGVELHGANGYLIQQFISKNSNHRTDEYGGSIDNRIKFAIEVAQAVAEEIGSEKVGFRISPGVELNGIDEGDKEHDIHPTYVKLVEELNKLDLAYIHVMHFGDDELLPKIRKAWNNTLLVNRFGRPMENLANDIDNGLSDISPIGQWALANPDIVERIKNDYPLNEMDPTTIYGGGEKGYIDYPYYGNK